MSSPYFDKRVDFFREYFTKAAPYEEYLTQGNPTHIKRWRDFEGRLNLDESLNTRLKSFLRTMPVLVLSGVWCGDCARQGPMLRLIEQASSLMQFRFIDNRQNPELLDELRINGAAKVPVIVAFSEDFFEISRFGDRHLSVYQRKAANELGPACDPGIVPPSSDSLLTELREWVDFFERCQLILRLSPQLRERYND